jgi:hypothetical protein
MLYISDIFTAMMYYNVNIYFNKKINEKHVINSVSTIHAASAFIFCFLYFNLNHNNILSSLIITNSCGYYLYDSIDQYIKLNKKFSIVNFGFLYHHLVSIYTFTNYNIETYQLLYLLYIAEIANIPTKIVYYLIKEEQIKNEKYILTNIMKIIQLIFYLYVRVYKVSIIYFNLLFSVEDRTPLIINSPLYILGLFWTYSIYKSTNFKLIKLKKS